MKHSNISIFIPHLGCPFNCIFCDQYKITGSDCSVTPLDVYNLLEKAADDKKLLNSNTQIAFFGGSFTAIDKNLMIDYLKAANEFIGDNMFDSIRISTRPDCINNDILETLSIYNVKTIELGIQSFDDQVLAASKRGYSSKTAQDSCVLISESGFELGLQMMCGLPCDTEQKDLYTAERIIRLNCKQVRIYPVIVIKGTKLCQMYQAGEYIPLSLKQAVDTCAKLYSLFRQNDVTILKMGLHSSSDNIAGPFHPAFGELVRSRVFYNTIVKELSKSRQYIVRVSPDFMSIAVGNSKINLSQFKNEGYDIKIIPDPKINKENYIIE